MEVQALSCGFKLRLRHDQENKIKLGLHALSLHRGVAMRHTGSLGNEYDFSPKMLAELELLHLKYHIDPADSGHDETSANKPA